MPDKLPIYKMQIDNHDPVTGVDYVAFVDRPAIELDWIAFSKQQEIFFAADDEKRIVAGPMMVPDMPIYRKVDGKEFYVVFDADTIKQVAYKYHRMGFSSNVNLMHDAKQVVKDVYLVENYIIDRENGITEPKYYGQELPTGTWFGMFKVENDAVWAKVKSGEVKGFSVEGIFGQVQVDEVEQEFREMLGGLTQDELEFLHELV